MHVTHTAPSIHAQSAVTSVVPLLTSCRTAVNTAASSLLSLQAFLCSQAASASRDGYVCMTDWGSAAIAAAAACAADVAAGQPWRAACRAVPSECCAAQRPLAPGGRSVPWLTAGDADHDVSRVALMHTFIWFAVPCGCTNQCTCSNFAG